MLSTEHSIDGLSGFSGSYRKWKAISQPNLLRLASASDARPSWGFILETLHPASRNSAIRSFFPQELLFDGSLMGAGS